MSLKGFIGELFTGSSKILVQLFLGGVGVEITERLLQDVFNKKRLLVVTCYY